MTAITRIESVASARDLMELSVQIARRVAYPGLEVRDIMRHFDHLAAPLSPGLPSDIEGLRQLSHFFAHQLRFRGNQSQYYIPENSFLNVVLLRRAGIPLSLSIVYMALAHEAGIEVHGVASPAHFLCRAEVAGGPLYIDPFAQGRIMTEEEAVDLLNRLVPSMHIRPEVHLALATTGDIVRRMLANLKPIYLKRQRLESVERLLRVQTELLPHDAMTWIERAAILVALKRRRTAADVATRALLEGGLQPGVTPQRVELLNLLSAQLAARN